MRLIALGVHMPNLAAKTAALFAGVALSLSGIPSAWGQNQPAKPAHVVDESSDGKVVLVTTGERVQLRLKGERRMTGWGGLDFTTKGVVVLKSRGFEAQPGAKDSAIGTYIYNLDVAAEGETAVQCRYIYPDGNGYENMPRITVDSVRVFRVTVRAGPKKK